MPDNDFALMIEDDDLMADILSLELRRLGYAIVARAHDGAEAAESVRRARPGLIVADIVLGPTEENGATVASALRGGAAIPLIFVSARPDLAAGVPACAVVDKRELSAPALRAALERACSLVAA